MVRLKQHFPKTEPLSVLVFSFANLIVELFFYFDGAIFMLLSTAKTFGSM